MDHIVPDGSKLTLGLARDKKIFMWIPVTELYSRENLLEESPGPILCQLAMLDDVVK